MTNDSLIFDYLLVKLSSRCNIDCKYCYWFRDSTVYTLPKVLTVESENLLLQRLIEHIKTYDLKEFNILFHGGEPLLFGKSRFEGLLKKIEQITIQTNCKFSLSITTNGIGIDKVWVRIFKQYNILVSISIDGPHFVNDLNRVDFKGRGTHQKVEKSILLLKESEIDLSVLAVCNVEFCPEVITEYFVDKLGINRFDIMLPDYTHEDKFPSISSFYKKLFDLWFDKYAYSNIRIRYPIAILKGLLGNVSEVESIGYGPIQVVTVTTDGGLEPLDVLRIAGNGSTKTKLNLLNNTFQDVLNDNDWLKAYTASLELNGICKKCDYVDVCGGGYLPHRFSKNKGYDNVSVYCEDLKDIFKHTWNRVLPLIKIQNQYNEISLSDFINT